MANEEHLQILKQGVKKWNEWRELNSGVWPSLVRANLRGIDLHGVNFFTTDLREANLSCCDLRNANLSGSILIRANLSDADLRGADLYIANMNGAKLKGADLELASMGVTILVNTDLRGVRGLEKVRHYDQSHVGIDTIYRSEGDVPDSFLRSCGVPESFIVQIKALIAATQPIQFHSCFISYSSEDEEFARCLHSRMREAQLRVWFAPEDMKGGDKIYDQIDRAIQVHDRLLLVLSENSLQSKWVETEIRRARKVELAEKRRKLFPIRLVSYEALQEWMCIDSTTGEDLAEEVRSYFIPNFSNWESHDEFERAFARLYADLKASTE